ncbi:MAG: hypothetical protein J2P46_08290 [Zavarzinella sp.]|nr:hypothetical protein [Zavarzinella sp.]
MASSVAFGNRPLSVGRIFTRGFAAAHSAVAGALLLALLHAPVQIASALVPGLRERPSPASGGEPEQIFVALALGAVFVLLTVAVFFLFPLIQGGILGQVRDRLESPGRPPGPFGAFARTYYSRLLGNQAVFALIMMAVVFPLICAGAVIAFRETADLMRPADRAATAPRPPAAGELEWRLLAHPVFLGGMMFVSLVSSAVGMIYWVANCAVVAEPESLGAAWRQSWQFCRRNLPAVMVVWLANLAAGVLLAPLGMLGQLGVITNPWVLSAVALVYAGLVGYWGLVLAGLTMSLYLGRRAPARLAEPAEPVAVAG